MLNVHRLWPDLAHARELQGTESHVALSSRAPEPEYVYGPAGSLPDTHVGTLIQALMDEAKADDWAVVSMKNDWNQIFP